MYGFRDEFTYLECGSCGCLQIQETPTNLSKYYPKNYWSFQQQRMKRLDSPSVWSAFARRRRTRYWLSKHLDPVGRILSSGKSIPRHITWARRANIRSLDAAVLDVGCGLGDRLLTLQQEGFTNLTGIDPYIDDDIVYPCGVKVFKTTLNDIDGAYDYITLHHSFEHMPEPISVIQKLHSLLKHGGTVLIRIPVVSSYAWRKYGVHWVQIDAPRHLYLHTIESMKHLAAYAGFSISAIYHDSEMFQFWGSEQYLRGIPLYDEHSYDINPAKSIFTEEQIAKFKLQTHDLNVKGDGDQACFYLTRV